MQNFSAVALLRSRTPAKPIRRAPRAAAGRRRREVRRPAQPPRAWLPWCTSARRGSRPVKHIGRQQVAVAQPLPASLDGQQAELLASASRTACRAEKRSAAPSAMGIRLRPARTPRAHQLCARQRTGVGGGSRLAVRSQLRVQRVRAAHCRKPTSIAGKHRRSQRRCARTPHPRCTASDKSYTAPVPTAPLESDHPTGIADRPARANSA